MTNNSHTVDLVSCMFRYHRRNFTLKSGGDQWRRQDLVSGGRGHDDRGAEGASIDAPKALNGRGRVWGGVSPSPAD